MNTPTDTQGTETTSPLRIPCAALGLLAISHAIWPSAWYLNLFLAAMLPLTFRLHPGRRRTLDWALAAAGAAAALSPLVAAPSGVGEVMGLLLVLTVLEATRRTTGWALPMICGALAVVGLLSGHGPAEIAAAASGEKGVFGAPVEVAATYVVLFSIYGAALNASGAASFFVNLSLSAFRRSSASSGRAVAAAGLAVGTVSGSSTATAVTLGSTGWPLLRRAGYSPDQGAGVLAASGVGAILSPPTLGAAAFIVADFIGTSYTTVLLYATLPAFLYYLGIVLAIELDARRLGLHAAVAEDLPRPGALLMRLGYHWLSIAAMVGLMAVGVAPTIAVLLAIALAVALSFLDRPAAIGPRRFAAVLEDGVRCTVSVAATFAAAGTITALVTLTGLGDALSGQILGVAELVPDVRALVLLVTALLTAGSVLVLGLALTTSASFTIAATVVAPALIKLGIDPVPAYMFIFYFAVLGEVSPPTALAATASAAITGGNPVRAMLHTLRYALPAFVVPFVLVVSPRGQGLLGIGPAHEIVAAVACCALAVAALAIASGGWLCGRVRAVPRTLCFVAAGLLLYVDAAPAFAGAACLGAAVALQLLRRRAQSPGATSACAKWIGPAGATTSVKPAAASTRANCTGANVRFHGAPPEPRSGAKASKTSSLPGAEPASASRSRLNACDAGWSGLDDPGAGDDAPAKRERERRAVIIPGTRSSWR